MSKESNLTIFEAIKSFLFKTARGIEQIADGIDDIEAAFNSYSGDFLSKGKVFLEQSRETLDSLKEKGLEKKTTVIGMIQDIIDESKEGLSIDVLIQKTGLAKTQVFSALAKLKEKGLVFPMGRGVYTSTPSTTTPPRTKKKAAKKKAAKKKAAKKAAKKKPAPKAPAGRGLETQTEQVLKAIEDGGEVSFKDLENQLTQFSKKSLQNTVFKLKKSGKIESPRRGIYKAV